MTTGSTDNDEVEGVIEALIEEHGRDKLASMSLDDLNELVRAVLEAGESLDESEPNSVGPGQVGGTKLTREERSAINRANHAAAQAAKVEESFAASERSVNDILARARSIEAVGGKLTRAEHSAINKANFRKQRDDERALHMSDEKVAERAANKASRTKENRKEYFLVEDTLLDDTWSEGEQRLMGEIALREQSNSYFRKLQFGENSQVNSVEFDSLVEAKIESSIAKAKTEGQILSPSELLAMRKEIESDMSGLGEKLAEEARNTITTRIKYLNKLDDEDLVKAAARVAMRMEMNLEYAATVDQGEPGADLTKPKSQFEEQEHIKQLRAEYEKIFDRLRVN